MSVSERALAAPRPAPVQPQRIVTEKDVHDALDFLTTKASALGNAKGRLMEAGRRVKRVEAMMFKASDAKTVENRKVDAITSKQWQDASDEEVRATIAYETLKAEKEAREILIEVYRTESSNLRGVRL